MNIKRNTCYHYNTLEKAAESLGINIKSLMVENVRSRYRPLNGIYRVTITSKTPVVYVRCLIDNTTCNYTGVSDVVVGTGIKYGVINDIISSKKPRLIAGYVIGTDYDEVMRRSKSNMITKTKLEYERCLALGYPALRGRYWYYLKCLVSDKEYKFSTHKEVTEFINTNRPLHTLKRSTISNIISVSRYNASSVLVRGFLMKAERAYDWVYPTMSDCVFNLRGVGRHGTHLLYRDLTTNESFIVRTGRELKEHILSRHGESIPRGKADIILKQYDSNNYTLSKLPHMVDTEMLAEIISGKLKIVGV